MPTDLEMEIFDKLVERLLDVRNGFDQLLGADASREAVPVRVEARPAPHGPRAAGDFR